MNAADPRCAADPHHAAAVDYVLRARAAGRTPYNIAFTDGQDVVHYEVGWDAQTGGFKLFGKNVVRASHPAA